MTSLAFLWFAVLILASMAVNVLLWLSVRDRLLRIEAKLDRVLARKMPHDSADW